MAAKEACQFCNAKFVPPQSFCPKCKQPTPHISANERILWELNQWETSHDGGPAPIETVIQKPAPVARPKAEPRVARVPKPAPSRVAPSVPERPAARVGPPTRVTPQPASAPAVRPAVRPAASAQKPIAARITETPANDHRPSHRPTQRPSVRQMPQRQSVRSEVQLERRPGAVIRRTGSAEAAVARVEAPIEVEQSILTVAPEVEIAPPVVTAIHAEPALAPAPTPTKSKAPKVKEPKPVKLKTPKPPKPPKPAKVKTPKAQKPASAKPAREAKPRFSLLPGETVEFTTRGWARMLPATLMITTYRVALTRLGRTRWIPLEEVRKTKAGKRTFLAEASIEMLLMRVAGGAAKVAQAMDHALREARRPNSRRHDAAVTQEWCDRCEIWDTHTGRIRLWLNRHPLMIISLVAALAAFIRVYLGPH